MKPPRNLIALLALLCAIALAVAGCGDDGDDGDDGATATQTATGPALSKEEFIRRADRICAEGDAEIDAEGLEFAGREDALNELVQTVIVPMTRQQVDQIRALTPPKGDEEQINEFLDTLERGLSEIEANPSLIATTGGTATLIEARQLADDYGFKSCNRGGGAPQGSGATVG